MHYSKSDVETATLSSTLPYEGNSITACPSSNVILTCMVTQRPTLRWEAVPGLSEQFFISQDIDRDRVTLVEGAFTLTLVNVSQPSGGVADLTSTLEVMVDDIDDGTNITCKGTTDEDYVVIHKRGSYYMHIEMSILMPYLERVYTLYMKIMHNMRLCAHKSF